jgi:hypothetical protein
MRTRMLFLCAFMAVTVTLAGSAGADHKDKDKDTPRFVPACGPGTAGVRVVLFDNGTNVCDNVSGMVWERVPIQDAHPYQAASDYCESKGPGWTLPALKDFYTLVDYANTYPPLPTGNPFAGIQGNQYWTSTPNVYYGGWVWTLKMDNGAAGSTIPETSVNVWCVRY